MGQAALSPTEDARSPVPEKPRPASITALAVGLAALAMGLAVLTIGFVLANRAHLHTLADIEPEDIVVPFSIGAVGALVATRQPRNVIGWLFLVIAVVSSLQGLSDQYARYAFVTHPGAVGGIWALWLDSWVVSLVFPRERSCSCC